MTVGKVIGGNVSQKLLIRLKSDSDVNVGDLLIISDKENNYYVKVINLNISSLLPEQFIEEIAGNDLEYEESFNIFDEKNRFYKIAEAKLLKINCGEFIPPRSLPNHFSTVKKVTSEDFKFLENEGEVPIGYLRLGKNYLKDVVIKLPAEKLISHHMLVTAATGKGKSNFSKVFINGLIPVRNNSCIVIDPHAEYYGSKNNKGLRDHNLNKRIEYFTPRWEEVPGSEELKIYTEDMYPQNFHGIINLSGAQKEAMEALYKAYSRRWIRVLLKEKPVNKIVEELGKNVMPPTLFALRRKIKYCLELTDGIEGLVFSIRKKKKSSIFEKIHHAILNGKIVIIDTSPVGSQAEKIISATIVSRMFNFYRKTKQINPESFNNLKELLIVFEEAPRVIGKDALARGTNIFERIAREGRKFKVGLCAITQMPSLIPPEILSQMNTKIILGIPAPSDRRAVVESSAQNISDEGTEIQMLDTGEALITSPFIKFPLPVKIFYFDDLIKKDFSRQKNLPEIGV